MQKILGKKEKETSKMFVAINFITCRTEYRPRFEELFSTRARAIDRMPGFISMQVLRSKDDDNNYLVVSQWEGAAAFQTWEKSAEFLEGHKRAFQDIKLAKDAGQDSPMTSTVHTYEVIVQ